jgi:hypothetical protein
LTCSLGFFLSFQTSFALSKALDSRFFNLVQDRWCLLIALSRVKDRPHVQMSSGFCMLAYEILRTRTVGSKISQAQVQRATTYNMVCLVQPRSNCKNLERFEKCLRCEDWLNKDCPELVCDCGSTVILAIRCWKSSFQTNLSTRYQTHQIIRRPVLMVPGVPRSNRKSDT